MATLIKTPEGNIVPFTHHLLSAILRNGGLDSRMASESPEKIRHRVSIGVTAALSDHDERELPENRQIW